MSQGVDHHFKVLFHLFDVTDGHPFIIAHEFLFFVDETRNKVVNHNENSQVHNHNSARYREQDNGDEIYLIQALILVEVENAMVD